MTTSWTADFIVTGNPIYTYGSGTGTVEAIAIDNGTVVALGSTNSVVAAAQPGTPRLEIDGAVLPGFCDTHMHFEKIAWELRMLDVSTAETIDDVLELVSEAADAMPPDDWIQSFGDDNAWHESGLRETRLPTREELDAAAPEHPVFLYRGGDAAALNTLAVESLQDALTGNPGWDSHTGHLYSPLARVLQERLPRAGDPAATLEQASRQLLSFGITTIVDPGLPAAFDNTWRLYRQARQESRVAQRLYLMDRLDYRRDYRAELRRIETSQIPRHLEDGGVHGWGLKLLVDGEFGNAWMAVGEPQQTPPTRHYTLGQIETALRLCAERDWPICFHVMGCGAVEAVLMAVRRTGGTAVFDRNQVTLAHGFFMSERAIEEAARLEVGVSVQPLLAYVFETEMREAWGEFAHHANPYRLMIDRGVEIAGGSDVLPCEPLRGAAVAVTRTSRYGSRLGSDQALTPTEAISLFTNRAGGYVRDRRLGTLEIGAPADFTAWPADPHILAPSEWSDLRPDLTSVGGRVVWRNPSLPAPATAYRKERAIDAPV